MTHVRSFVYVTLVLGTFLVNANSISGQKEGIDKITLALLDIRDLLAEANNSSQEGYRDADGGVSTINKTVEFSILVNATTTRLDELTGVTTKHGELLAYLLNRVNEIHNSMEAVAREIVARDDAKNDIGAMIEAMAKGMEHRDLTVKRLQESFAAMAKEVLLKDLVTMELRDRLEEMNESLQAKSQELKIMQERMDVLSAEMEFLRTNCCSYDDNQLSLESLATATYLVYANSTVKSTDTVLDESDNKTDPQGIPRECPPPFKMAGRGCFYVHTGDVRTWAEAREYCKHMRGDLAEPEDVFSLRVHLQERQDTIRGFFWLGGTDEQNPGVWRWASGAPLNLDADEWSVGQPDGKLQHCLYLDAGRQFKAGNLGCQNHTYFVCEKKLT
ncbi:C-type lectin domain family 4 member F-like [Macrobrachium rosenbergii]|uniref:C-type lectin domain family 4 member F-like n=1 Tax=Macrobrachium rosenbergii TaxID=79674 RepID=UPI0034D7B408